MLRRPRLSSNAVGLLALATAVDSSSSPPLPAYPLIAQNPLISVWAPFTALNAADTMHWGGFSRTFTGAVRVDGVVYAWMGDPGRMGQDYKAANQTSVVVTATSTAYSFIAGPVTLNVTFTSPLLLDDCDLLSPGVTHIDLHVTSTDGNAHDVQLLYSNTGEMAGGTQNEPVVWSAYSNASGLSPGRTYAALRMGAADQQLLNVTGDNRALSWGWVYTVVDATGCDAGSGGWCMNVSTAQHGYGPIHSSFGSTGTLPASAAVPPGGAPNQGNNVNGSLSFPSSAVAWSGTVPEDSSPLSARVMYVVDEVFSIRYYGTPLPPYWRRNYPLGDYDVVPWDSIDAWVSGGNAAIAAAVAFDARMLELIAPVADAAGNYAAVVASSYRQVVAQTVLVWHPTRNEAWHIMREGAGPIATVDVIFPASPLFTVLAPALMQAQLLPTLVFCSNGTSTPYPLPYAMHDLGIWPIADRDGDPGHQENMPIEETANMLIMLAALAMRRNDVEWLAAFWPVLTTWGGYLSNTLPGWTPTGNSGMPFPGNQLTTDDFAGAMDNSTNLALKGIVGLAAWGILQHVAGNESGAQAAWTLAGEYGYTWTQYGWWSDPSQPGGLGGDSHPTREYLGSEDGATSWCMPYNMMHMRALGLDSLLPNQTYYVNQTLAFLYTRQRDQYGVPLMSTINGTKTDWSAYMAALSRTSVSSSDGVPTAPGPSPYSDWTWASTMAAMAAEQASADRANHLPFPDYYGSDDAGVRFYGRSVLGAVWAPVMVHQQESSCLNTVTGPDCPTVAQPHVSHRNWSLALHQALAEGHKRGALY